MPRQGTIYRVLIASPSDCIKERQLVPDVIHAWNAAHSLSFGAILHPVLWETHARPELGNRPQAIINKQLVDNCDILIGTFWTRLGTRTGKAESGTAEEIEEFRSKGKPVLIYFSSMPVVPASLDAEQYKALLEYRQKLEQEGLCSSYETLEQLRQSFNRHIASLMEDLHPRSGSPRPLSEVEHLREYQIEFELFLGRLQVEWESECDSEPYNIDVGQLILSNALAQLLSFRWQSINVNGFEGIKTTLDEVARELRALQRFQLLMDGGESLRKFWTRGDAVIDKLKTIPASIEEGRESIGSSA